MQNAKDAGAKSNARDEYSKLNKSYQEGEAKLEALLAETSDLETAEIDGSTRLAMLRSQQKKSTL